MKLHNLRKVLISGAGSPFKLAFSITLSVVLGLFPFFFLPTLLIVFASLIFRLNLPLMMAVNYIVWPLQIILFMPYIHFGNWLFHANGAPVSFIAMVHIFKTGFTQGLHSLFAVLTIATSAWAISSIPAGLLLYAILRFITGRLWSKCL